MRLGVLKAIGHNIAASVAGGCGFMLGYYGMEIFDEAASTSEGYIEVDFLSGTTSGGTPSISLARGLKLYSEKALPELCETHGASPSDFRQLKARFWFGRMSPRFEVLVEDREGRCSRAEYEGYDGKRVKILDHLGRVRPK